jgi:hypothetical protein
MYNNPSGDFTRVSIGPGRLYLGAAGSTPAIEVGYVKGDAAITFKREQVEVRQGSPQTIIDALVKAEDLMFEINGIEWNLDMLAYVIGDGSTSVSGADEIFRMGGKPTVNKRALRFVHIAADGSTIDLHIFKVIGEGTIAVGVKAEDTHEFPYKFKAIDPNASTDWAGATLSNGQKLCKIIRTRV